MDELDARLLSPCRGRLKHLPARNSFSLFNCTSLIGKYLYFLIAFYSDCHTEDNFSFFFFPLILLIEFFCTVLCLAFFCLVFIFSFVSSSMVSPDRIYTICPVLAEIPSIHVSFQHSSLSDTCSFYATLLHLQPLGR